MIEVKGLEIRDKGTCIPTLAFRVFGGESDRLFWKAGFGAQYYVILLNLNNMEANYDPFAWRCHRTWNTAHLWIQENWDNITTGAVVDVEFILKERATPKKSEIWR